MGRIESSRAKIYCAVNANSNDSKLMQTVLGILRATALLAALMLEDDALRSRSQKSESTCAERKSGSAAYSVSDKEHRTAQSPALCILYIEGHSKRLALRAVLSRHVVNHRRHARDRAALRVST